ncbi:Rv2578c family radical SAM protein [Microbacterium sp. NIBRBAC000506063]|uniref:Rv2578c family radical SAM protein n=1 Tax=Microbacterium sp. NIBRBAC000506063 TaxID=2734618 RepID=UPI001BB5B91C|nr:Rv2578c family radical SAM protein [Microbacterium sp. NIBRBAC000506063]QTV80249.1 Rv2578c family radical SAM protein [Microbacterium sp. NIBRBAC000506063]
MRWQGQEIGATDAAALPGLEHLGGLVQSVTTPDFAGITFHEVLCKSALNRVPGSSAMPFDWTINPYRGCSHACVYCLSPDTLVLMADGRQRRIADLGIGDEIIGTERQGSYRRYVRTSVQAKWSTRKRAYKVELADGTELVASGDHRFLTERGWKHVTGDMSGTHQRPYLTPNNRLMGFGVGLLSDPAITRKVDLTGTAVKTVADLRVMSVTDLGEEIDMVDITTGTGDFIANGVISHNCFARRTHEYLELDAGRDFDSQIVVKVNVAEVLRRELARSSWSREPVALGTNTDPYQRAEGRYRLMPGIISALTDAGTPFSILTKGTLLRRDLPMLTEAAASVDVEIALSIAVFDDALQRSIEPGTPSAAARLATVRAATDAGFRVTVFLMPLLPHLTDSIPAIEHALTRIKEAGAARVVYGALHLRPGAKQWFFRWLEREHPELLTSYRALYPGASATAPKVYRSWLAKRMRPMLRIHGLDGHDEDDPPRRAPIAGLAARRSDAASAPRPPHPLPACSSDDGRGRDRLPWVAPPDLDQRFQGPRPKLRALDHASTTAR